MTIFKNCANQILESKYTVYNDKKVNEAIGRQVLKLTTLVLAQVKDVYSLHLLGGYGRGEGSMIREKGGIIPLGDYDFLVVSARPHFRLRISGIDHLQKVFHVQYHVGVDCLWKPLLPFLGRRIYWYEAKFGNKLLWGDKRSLDSIPISNSKDIDLQEGFSLMFNRLAGLERVFDPSLLESDLTKEQRQHFIFQSAKAILACGDALLLLYGKYHYSYEERSMRFLERSRRELSEYLAVNPNLRHDYQKATDFKLRPSFAMFPNPVRYWMCARDHILQTSAFFLSKTISIRSIKRTKRKLRATPFEDFPELFLKTSKPEILDFIIFNQNMVKHMKSFRNFLYFQGSFSDLVRVCLYHLASSIKAEGEIDRVFLEKALTDISKVLPVSKKIALEEDIVKKWKLTRNIVQAAWRLSRS